MTTDPHLKRVEILGFRGLSDLRLDGLGRFNLLLGANDVGKTSVLEAVFLLAGFPNLELPIRVQSHRNLPPGHLKHLNVLFQDLDADQPIRLVGHSRGAIARRELKISAPPSDFDLGTDSSAPADSGNGAVPTSRVTGEPVNRSSSLIPAGQRILRYDVTVEPRDGEPSQFSATLRVEGDRARVETSNDPMDQEAIPARYVSQGLGYDVQTIGDLIVHKQAEQLVGFLKVINPRIRAVAVSGGIAYLDTGSEQMLPLNVFGGGMARAASILSHCLRGKERVLLVDELENGLHHAAIRPLLETLLVLSRDRDIQVFVTTHSLAVLESLLDVLRSDGFAEHRAATRSYTLQRDQEGRIRPYRYDYEQFEHCVRQGIEIR